MKNQTKVNQGRKNRASGKAFELKVRKELEGNGWFTFRNSNDVEFSLKAGVKKDAEMKNEYPMLNTIVKFSQAKSKFNPFTKRVMMMQSGFPDFVAFKPLYHDAIAEKAYNMKQGEPIMMQLEDSQIQQVHRIAFIECKSNGSLSKLEKDKCNWIINNLHIPIYIASKGEKRGMINYKEYKDEM